MEASRLEELPMLARAFSLPLRVDKWSAWDHFIEGHPTSGFMQTSWWARFRSLGGAPSFGVVVRRQGIVLGGGLIQCRPWGEGGAYYHLPEGPILPSDPSLAGEVLSSLFSTVLERGRRDPRRITHLRFEPRWRELPRAVAALGLERAPANDPATIPRRTIQVELRTSETAILARMPVEERANIAWARTQGLTVVEDPSPAGVADFLELTEGASGATPFLDGNAAHVGTLIGLLHARGHGTLHFAEHRGIRIAAALVITLGPRATWLVGGVHAGPWEAIAPALLHFEIMRRARRLHCHWYEVPIPGVLADPPFGIPEVPTATGPTALGGTLITFVPAFDLVLDPAGYGRYREGFGG